MGACNGACAKDEELAVGPKESQPCKVLTEWQSCCDVESRCRRIFEDLTSDAAEVLQPPAAEARADAEGRAKRLEEGDRVKLRKMAAGEWFGVNSKAPNFVSLVGPGNDDLKELSEIAKGLPWVVFGVLFCYHEIPVKRQGVKRAQHAVRDFQYTGRLQKGGAVSEEYLVKYPFPREVARITLDLKVRLSAHLNDGFAADVYEGGTKVLEWLEACHFCFVQLNHDSEGLKEFWREKEESMEQVGKRVAELMRQFGSLTFILPSSGKESFQRLNAAILEWGPRNVYVLHDSSQGTGREAWTFPRPQDSVPCGYAGGFTPENMLQKLELIRWATCGLPFFVDLQSGLRSGVVKGSTDRRERYGIFDVEKAKELVRSLAESPRDNPAQGQEVFQGRDGSLRLGSGLGSTASVVLLPNCVYLVSKVDKERCQFKLKLPKGESPAMAASIVSKLVFEDGRAISRLRPPLRPCTTLEHKASRQGVGEPMLAKDLALQAATSCFPVEGSLGARYKERTAAQSLHLLASAEAEEVKRRKMPTQDDAEELLERWSTGQLLTFESGLGSGRFLSLALKGFPGRAGGKQPWGGDLEKLQDRGVAVVSIPGENQALFNTVTRICLEDGIFFAAVWESDWGNVWFLAWLRNVVHAVLEGYVPLVLTKERGALGKAQSIEVHALQYLGLPFACMEIGHFVRQCRPFHGAIHREAWAELKDWLNEPGEKPGLAKRDGEGFTPLILAVDRKAPLGLVGALITAKANPSDHDSHGRTALHWAARRLAKSAEEEQQHWHDLLSLLLSVRSDLHLHRNFSGRTVSEYCEDYLPVEKRGRLQKLKDLLPKDCP